MPAGALFVVSVDPDQPGPLHAARRVRRGRRQRRGPADGQRAQLRRAVPRLLRHEGGRRAQVRRPHRRPDRGRRRQARLRADPQHPRAAHPPREGVEQHLLQPGAERAGRRDLHGRDGQVRPAHGRRAELSQGALRGRADRRAGGLRGRATGPFFKEFVVRCPAPVARSTKRCWTSTASSAATTWGRTTRS